MKAALIAVLIALAPAASSAQGQKPQVELTPSPAPAAIAPGGKGRLTLKVKLPKDVHVQSDRPDDPSLIATVLTVTLAPGITVDRIVYPEAARLQQAGRGKPLAVFGPELAIDVHVSVAPGAPPGRVTQPAQLRYQACNEQVCFAPARAPVEWAIAVGPSTR